MRDRLIELIASKVCIDYSPLCDERVPHSCEKCYANSCRIGEIADCLLANIDLFPPVSVGDQVWIGCSTEREYVLIEGKVSMIQQKADRTWNIRVTLRSRTRNYRATDIGKTVFLTREEAEQALKGEHNAEIH